MASATLPCAISARPDSGRGLAHRASVERAGERMLEFGGGFGRAARPCRRPRRARLCARALLGMAATAWRHSVSLVAHVPICAYATTAKRRRRLRPMREARRTASCARAASACRAPGHRNEEVRSRECRCSDPPAPARRPARGRSPAPACRGTTASPTRSDGWSAARRHASAVIAISTAPASTTGPAGRFTASGYRTARSDGHSSIFAIAAVRQHGVGEPIGQRHEVQRRRPRRRLLDDGGDDARDRGQREQRQLLHDAPGARRRRAIERPDSRAAAA